MLADLITITDEDRRIYKQMAPPCTDEVGIAIWRPDWQLERDPTLADLCRTCPICCEHFVALPLDLLPPREAAMNRPAVGNLGQRLRALRLERGIGMDRLGRLAGVSGHTVWRIEKQGQATVKAAVLAKLARALGVEIEELQGERDA